MLWRSSRGSVSDNLFGTEQNSFSWMIPQYVVKTRSLLFKSHGNFIEMSVRESPRSLFFLGILSLPSAGLPGSNSCIVFSAVTCFCQGFSPSMSSLEIWPFPDLMPTQPHNLFPLYSSTLLDAPSVRRLGMGWERRSRQRRSRSVPGGLADSAACGQVTGEHFCVDDSQTPRTGVALHLVEKANVDSRRPDAHSCPWQAG